MKWISGSVCAVLIAGSAFVVAGRAAAVDDPTPYDSCARTPVNATTEHLSCSFTTSGAAQDFTIPHIATALHVFAIGGHGEAYAAFDPLKNTSLDGPLPDSLAGATVSIRVGGNGYYGTGGYNGGADSAEGGAGGGASDISVDGNRVFVAPGGGGSGGTGSHFDTDSGTYDFLPGGAGGRTPYDAGDGTYTSSPGYCILHEGYGAFDPSDGTGSPGNGGYADTCNAVGGGYSADGVDGTADGHGGAGGAGKEDGTPSACGIFGVGGGGGGGGGGFVGGAGGGAGAIGSGNDCASGGGGAAGSPLLPVANGVYAHGLTSDPAVVTISWDQKMTFTTPATLPSGTAGQPYSYQLATDASGSTFRVVSGTTPPGITLTTSGQLKGTPTTAASYGFTVEATDADHAAQRTKVQSLTIDTPQPVTFTNGAPPQATVGQPYSFPFTASGCAGCSFKITSGGVPPGLKLASSGVLSGTPTGAGKYAVTVTATDNTGRSASQSTSVRAVPPPVTIAVNDVAVTESSGTAKFTVSLNRAASTTVTVKYATANGTAVQPGDYTKTSGTLSFAAGATAKTVSVPIVNDTTHEGAETFTLVLSSASGATIADASGKATIAASD